jgi:hypothetical protein
MDAIRTQKELVLEHLQAHKQITPLEALSLYGCYRLGAIIFKLKREGHKILTELEICKKDNGSRTRYAVYKLEENNGIT